MFDPFTVTAIVVIGRAIAHLIEKHNESTSSTSSTTTSTPTIERQKHVVFVGRTNSGKSTLANALFGTDFTVGPTHGVTSIVQHRAFGNDGWQVVDTPGILDTIDYSYTVLNAIKKSKLTVFVTTGQMFSDEHEFLRKVWLDSESLRLIVFVNKHDNRQFRHTSREIEVENELIRKQVQEVSSHAPVIFGSASPMRNGQRWQPEIQELREKINEKIGVF